MSNATVTIIGIADSLAPFVALEELREDVRRRHYETDAQRSSGVCHGGMGPTPRTPRTPEQVREDAKAACEKAAAFANSPRGRFLLAIRSLQDLGYGAEAETARAAFARGFASADRAACPAEVGCALKALAGLNHPDARTACLALGDLLSSHSAREAA